jgi:mevalonate kinase
MGKLVSVTVSAPGKLILCGEHAVVYNRPAIALPLSDVRAYATLRILPAGSGLHINAPDLGQAWQLTAVSDDPLSELSRAVLRELAMAEPDLEIRLCSDIPIAGGMGSGAAIAAGLVRALAAHAGSELAPDRVAELVYASEQRYHGTPSGIDNTVIAYEQPVWFQCRSGPGESPQPPLIEPLAIGRGFTLLVGDTGVRSATHLPVGEVRRRQAADPAHYTALFNEIGALVQSARQALAAGDVVRLGELLNRNQELLAAIGVSSPELETLIGAARSAGAGGAKLSGGGWGGVMIALVTDETGAAVTEALQRAGAARVLHSIITPTPQYPV